MTAWLLGLTLAWANPPYGLEVVDYQLSQPLTSAGYFPDQYPAQEIPGGAPGVALVRTDPKFLLMTFRNTIGIEHDATVSFGLGVYFSAGGYYLVNASPASTVIHFTAGGSATILVELIGLPNFVTLGDLTLPYTCSSEHTSLGGNAGMRVYLLDDMPLGYPHGLQVPVWTNVLEDACLWATFRTGPSECRWWCTYKLSHSMVFVYDSRHPYYVGTNEEIVPPATVFRLTEFFQNRNSAPEEWTHGDCHDVSAYLQIALSSIGVTIQTHKVYPLRNEAEVSAFTSNKLCSIGNSATVPGNYGKHDFEMHQFCATTGPHIGGKIYDASLAHWMDPAGAGYQNPPMDWAFPDYWQKDHRPTIVMDSGFYGFAWGYPNPLSPPEGEPVGHDTQLALLDFLL